MILHAVRTHPTPVDGCWACGLASIAFSGEAMVTRSPEVVEAAARERRWQKDIPAYVSMRKQGVQPRSSDGAHELMQRSNTVEEVEGLPKLWKHRDEILADYVPSAP